MITTRNKDLYPLISLYQTHARDLRSTIDNISVENTTKIKNSLNNIEDILAAMRRCAPHNSVSQFTDELDDVLSARIDDLNRNLKHQFQYINSLMSNNSNSSPAIEGI